MNQSTILRATVYGLYIYGYILGKYYKGKIDFDPSGEEHKPVRNPFNGDKETLVVIQRERNGMVFYYDTELPEFKGNPFDFAALHYQLKGEELLEKINQDMHLNDGKGPGFYPLYLGQKPIPVTELAVPHFSFFRKPITNVRPYASVSLEEVYKLIKSSRYKARTQELRTITDPCEGGRFKQLNFDYVTFSGVFKSRKNSALDSYSGLLVFDFDHVADLDDLKGKLMIDNYFVTALLFISPSGHGLKWVIPVNPALLSHQLAFKSVSLYLKKRYQMEVDQSGKDISRACFLCHDPEVYINPDYLIN